MIRLLSGISLSLMSLLAYALEETVNIPPPNTNTDPTAMIVFAVLFVVVIAGFVFYLWRNEQKRKQQGTATE